MNLDISLIMHDIHMQLNICIENFAVEGTVSKICCIGPGSISIKSRSKYSKIYKKKLPVFLGIKSKQIPKKVIVLLLRIIVP